MQNFEHEDQLARIKDGRLDLAIFVLDEDATFIRTETIALLSLLQSEFPTLLGHNSDHGGSAYFPTSSASQSYMVNGGPEWADTHVPWLVDIMPISNWFYVVMAISILFNVMTSAHKFRLWRIDAKRERAQQVFRDILGSRLTPPEMHVLLPSEKHLKPESITKIDQAIAELDELRETCRKQENSALVPMGQELAYRYQEEQMELTRTAVREFRRKIDDARIDDARVDAGAEPVLSADTDDA